MESFRFSVIEYKVWIVPGKQYQFAQSSQTSANVYMFLNGELGKTDKILLPKNCNEFSFKVGVYVYCKPISNDLLKSFFFLIFDCQIIFMLSSFLMLYIIYFQHLV